MNRLTIIGNLTADPEDKYVNTPNGQQLVCNFTVAVNRKVRETTYVEYFRVSCWNKQAENVKKYLFKGSKVCVEGPAVARAYAAHDGTIKANIEIPATTIEFLSSSRQGGNTQAQGQQAQGQQVQGQQTGQMQPAPNAEDGFMNIPPYMDEGMPFG